MSTLKFISDVVPQYITIRATKECVMKTLSSINFLIYTVVFSRFCRLYSFSCQNYSCIACFVGITQHVLSANIWTWRHLNFTFTLYYKGIKSCIRRHLKKIHCKFHVMMLKFIILNGSRFKAQYFRRKHG